MAAKHGIGCAADFHKAQGMETQAQGQAKTAEPGPVGMGRGWEAAIPNPSLEEPPPAPRGGWLKAAQGHGAELVVEFVVGGPGKARVGNEAHDKAP